MTFPQHIKWVARGVFKNTPEIWSFSFKLDSDVGGATDPTSASFHDDQVKTALTNFFATGVFGSLVECTGWRAYDIGPLGTMVGNPHIVEYGPGQTIVGNGVSSKPPQCAVVITTVGANRGPARFGRMFLPLLAYTLGTDLRISAADRNQTLSDTVTFLKALSDSVDVAGGPVGVNACNVSAIGSGVKQTIDHIRMGRVYDTHRSRRGALLEDYSDSGHIDW